MRKSWLPAAAAVLLVAIVAGAILLHHARSQSPAKPMAATKPVAPMPAEISLPGKVQATKVVPIPAPVDGIIERFMVDVGEDVFEGEVLAHIRSVKLDTAQETAKQDLDHARSRVNDLGSALVSARLQASKSHAEAVRTKGDLERAEKTYIRQQMLMREGATPRLTFESAEKDYTTLKADAASLEELSNQDEDRVSTLRKELQAAQATLEQKTSDLEEAAAELAAGDVHSPGDGVVIARRGQAGEAVNRAMPELFQIAVDLSALEIAVSPDAETLSRVHSGQTAVIEIAEAPGGIPGTVREVKQGQVLVSFTSPTPLVRPGLTAQVKIKLG